MDAGSSQKVHHHLIENGISQRAMSGPRGPIGCWAWRLITVALLVLYSILGEADARQAKPSSKDEAEQTTGRPDLGVPGKDLAAYDRDFDGTAGKRFKELVARAAKEVDVDPGLLAVNLLAETKRSVYLSKEKVDSFVIGTDDYYEKRQDIQRKVPAAAKVKWERQGRDVNENKREVITIRFESGEVATLASAVYLKHGEQVLRDEAERAGRNFDELPLETRFALTRLAFNAGHGRARDVLKEQFGGKDILIKSGPTKPPWGPQRAATVQAARAIHISSNFFP